MKQLVVSTVNGRSKVVKNEPLEASQSLTLLWEFAPGTIEVPDVPGQWTDIGVQTGRANWLLWHQPPGATTDLHHSMTMDLFIILAGSATLHLDDESIDLEAGDHVRCEGANHKWEWGPGGGSLAILNLSAVARAAT